MSSEVVGEEFQLKDIPYVQYFQEGYALHAAYWHDDFGIPRSHGCINLAPEDARWLFDWTEPQRAAALARRPRRQPRKRRLRPQIGAERRGR